MRRDCTRWQRGGRLVPVGFTEGRISDPDPALVASRNLTVFNGWGRNNFKSREEQAQGALAELLQLMSQDKFRPLIDKVFPLSEAGEAHRYLDSRQQFGKVILSPNRLLAGQRRALVDATETRC